MHKTKAKQNLKPIYTIVFLSRALSIVASTAEQQHKSQHISIPLIPKRNSLLQFLGFPDDMMVQFLLATKPNEVLNWSPKLIDLNLTRYEDLTCLSLLYQYREHQGLILALLVKSAVLLYINQRLIGSPGVMMVTSKRVAQNYARSTKAILCARCSVCRRHCQDFYNDNPLLSGFSMAGPRGGSHVLWVCLT